MNQKTIVIFLLACISSSLVKAQYYYRDIISNNQLVADMKAFKENKVKSININSYENDGSPSDGFFCQKKISRDYSNTELFTRSNVSAASMLTSTFNKKGLLLQTKDSSVLSVTTNRYSYDDKDRIVSIMSTIHSADDDFSNQITEEHLYQYAANGAPEKMIRIKNFSDSTDILFATDEHNMVTIEKDTKSGTKYYYYYDAKQRLTDVVQENDFKKGVTPEYKFDYSSQGNLSQMMTIEEGGNDYFIWKYNYDNGLRIAEKCYNKQRRLMGSIEYDYKFK